MIEETLGIGKMPRYGRTTDSKHIPKFLSHLSSEHSLTEQRDRVIDEEYQQHEDFYIVLANWIADILEPGIEAWYFLYVRLQWLCVSSLS